MKNKYAVLLWVFLIGASFAIAGNLDKVSGELMMFFKPSAVGNVVRVDAAGKFYDGPGIGTAANNLVQLDGSAKLPAVDGSQLTGITATGNTGAVANTLAQRDAIGALTASKFYNADGLVVGEWTLVERKTVADSAVQSITFNTGVDGDSARRFKVVGFIINGANAQTTYSISPRADTTTSNYHDQTIQAIESSASAWQPASYAGFWGALAWSNGLTTFDGVIYATSGTNRLYRGFFNANEVSTTVDYCAFNGGMWLNNADNIDSILFGSNQVGGYGVGSYIELWKLNQ